ncbi:MAG: hypothetical protein IPI34_01730 [bacterium]|nr:hypothetical protein [bacterium]
MAAQEPVEADLAGLQQDAEWNLVREIVRLPEVILGAAESREPHRLTAYAADLAGSFHQFYHQCVIVGEDRDLTRVRLQLCLATRKVLRDVLDLIGVEAPEQMGDKE